MSGREQSQDLDLDAQAQAALDEARAMPSGPEKAEALRKAGQLRNAADVGDSFSRNAVGLGRHKTLRNLRAPRNWTSQKGRPGTPDGRFS
jgi:hypothetical protein